jgi:hypothetical protein
MSSARRSGQDFPPDRAADAHAAIEARSSTGKTLLRVEGAEVWTTAAR